MSYINNCSGAMFRWSGHHTAWELIDGAVQNIGSVQRWATLRNAGVTYLVTSAGTDYSCPYKGGNVWRFEPALKLRVRMYILFMKFLVKLLISLRAVMLPCNFYRMCKQWTLGMKLKLMRALVTYTCLVHLV